MLQQLAEKNGRMRKNNGLMHCIAILFSSFVVSFGNSPVLGKLLDTASAVLSLLIGWWHLMELRLRYILRDLCVFVPP